MFFTESLKKYLLSGLCIVLSTGLISCSKDDKDDKKNPLMVGGFGVTQIGKTPLASPAELLVVDTSGKALSGVQVMIGTVGKKEELLTTDNLGRFDAPKTWVKPETVSFRKDGYIPASYLMQTPTGQNFVLRKQEAVQNLELKGGNPGFQVKDRDGKVDFAMNVAAVSRSDIFQFQLNQVISDQDDTIEIIGRKVDVPSNITFPAQKEKYTLIDVSLNKPQYRMYFSNPGAKKVFALRGQFPLKEVVDGLRKGKQFVDMINYFSILGGGFRNVNIAGPTQGQDIPVNEIDFTGQQNFVAPAIAADEVVLAAGLGENQGLYAPTDLKQVSSGQSVSLRGIVAPNSMAMAVLKKKTEISSLTTNADRMSVVLSSFDKPAQPVFMPIIDNPRVQSAFVVQVPAVKLDAKLKPVGMQAVLSQKVNSKEAPLWDVYSAEWTAQIEIPVWPEAPALPTGLRWSVSLAGGLVPQSVDLGPGMLNSVTHVTRASTDF